MGTLSSTEIVPDGEVPGELLRELAEWMRRMFGEEELKYTWADIDWHVLLWYEGRLASHAAITSDVCWDAFKCHHGYRSRIFCNFGLFGIHDIHNDSAFEHLGETGF